MLKICLSGMNGLDFIFMSRKQGLSMTQEEPHNYTDLLRIIYFLYIICCWEANALQLSLLLHLVYVNIKHVMVQLHNRALILATIVTFVLTTINQSILMLINQMSPQATWMAELVTTNSTSILFFACLHNIMIKQGTFGFNLPIINFTVKFLVCFKVTSKDYCLSTIFLLAFEFNLYISIRLKVNDHMFALL